MRLSRRVGARGGAGSRLMSSGVWSQGPGISALAKQGEPELCGECKEPGGLPDGGFSHSPMRREQIIYSLIRVRVPRAGEWWGWGLGLLFCSPPPARRPLPAPRLPARTHTFPDN